MQMTVLFSEKNFEKDNSTDSVLNQESVRVQKLEMSFLKYRLRWIWIIRLIIGLHVTHLHDPCIWAALIK